MGVKIASLVLFSSLVMFCHECTTASTVKICSLRSVYRYKYQTTDCSLLKVEVNSTGEPSIASYKGHCCHHNKHKEFKVLMSSQNRKLEATFQWSHDNRYYLTAKSIGNQLSLEKPGSSITNNHKFLIKSSNTPGCRDCITIQSKATSRYMSSGTNGQVVMTTNRKLNTALFSLHTCNSALAVLCKFMDVSCQT